MNKHILTPLLIMLLSLLTISSIMSMASASPLSVEASRTLDKTTVKFGETLTITLTYTPSEDVIGLIITEKLPLGFKLVSASPEPDIYNEAEGIAKWLFRSIVRIEPGTITYKVLVPEDAELGTYIIEGIWAAASLTETAEGVTKASQFEVKKAPSTITLSVSPKELKVEEEASITGRIEPPHANVEVTLIYALTGKVEVTHKVRTEADGTFTDAFRPDKSGTWEIQASWLGDYDHESAASEKITLKVAKIPTSLTLSVSKETIKVDEKQEVTGKISPPIPNLKINITYTKPDGTTIARKVVTASDGSFEDIIKPDMGGSWGVAASWKGDEKYEWAKAEATFTVMKIPTSIELSPPPKEVEVGKELTITGKILPPIVNVEIILTYTKAGEVKITHTVTTALDGAFKDTITPDAGGTWTVKASWEGNEKYEATESEEVSFEAVEKRCIIATATYGSEMAPQIHYLRGFREAIVYQTYAGSQFMKLFNTFYYSWSPYVAGLVWKYPALKPVMQSLLNPLLTILHVATITYQTFSFNSEAGIILAGLVTCSLIGLIYLTPPVTLALLTLKRRGKTLPKINQLKPLLALWAASLTLLIYGEIIASTTLTTIASGMLATTTTVLIASSISLKVIYCLQNMLINRICTLAG
jgi:hypothetical protein